MSARLTFAFVVISAMAALSACAASTDGVDSPARTASTASRLGGGPSSVPYPVKSAGGTIQHDPEGHAVPSWGGTIVDIMAADAWAQCGAHVASDAELATDGYLAYLEVLMDQATCPGAISQVPPTSDFGIANCGTTVSTCPSKVKRWARQRQIASCNVNPNGADAVVGFYGNAHTGHKLASTSPAHASAEFSGLQASALSNAVLDGAVASAQKEVDIAEVNLCMAQRLRENMASAESLFLDAADLRQLLEIIRERVQIATVQYALLGRTFTNPDDRGGGPAFATQSFITLMHWSKQFGIGLSEMGEDLAAAAQLHVSVTQELAELLSRSASGRTSRGGAATNNAQADFGSGSWRQRLLSLLYGGNPLRSGSTPAEIDPTAVTSQELNSILEAGIQSSEPWDTAWTEITTSPVDFPNFLPAWSPPQRYAKTPTTDPQVRQLLALARKADALYLKELNRDFLVQPVFEPMTFRGVDIETTAPLVWALAEASLRTEECKKTNPSCLVGVNDPSMPTWSLYGSSLLWKTYGIQPAHASTLVSMLADVVPLLSEGSATKWESGGPSVPYEQTGALHVTGASRTLNAGELAARLPGHEAEVWFRLDPAFSVSPQGNPERAPLYSAMARFFVPRAFDKWNVPSSQGFGSDNVRSLGAISAMAVVRNLLEDSLAGASSSIAQTYLAKVPHALKVIDGAIGNRSISIRPSSGVQNLYRYCSDFDPSLGTVECPTITQVSSPDGLTAQWNVSVRTELGDPFFTTPVSLVIVPFQGGIESAAAIDPNYSSFKGATRATLLDTTARVEVPLSASTTVGTTAEQREASVDLATTTSISSIVGNGGTFTVFLKRTVGGQAEYQLLAQRVALRTSIQNRAIGNGSAYALVGLPSDGQYFAYGGVLGQMAARSWVARSDDWSKPAYDGFGLATDWVPPFDPSLLGSGDDASATYLRNARAAADEATAAVKTAIDELLQQEVDDVTLGNARRKAATITQLEQRALCGDAKPDCDTSTTDLDTSFFPVPDCSSGSLCGRVKEMRQRVVPKSLPLATAVYARRFDKAAPSFNEYAGGTLQAVLIEQWATLQKLYQLTDETSRNLISHETQVAVADAELAQANAQQAFECSNSAMSRAYQMGYGYPVDTSFFIDSRDEGNGVWRKRDGSLQWSPSSYLAQRAACERARVGLNPGYARHASVIAEGWSWLASQTTLLQEAGAAVQAASAHFAKAQQDTKLAKAQAQLEATLTIDNLKTKFGTYRRYHSYDVWRARALLESTRRYAVAARRAIEARYVVDLSEMRSDEPFVAAPATWADEIYEYDLSAPASVGLTAIPTAGNGIYPNRLLDYVGNLERFVAGYAVARPTAIAHNDDELFHVPGPDVRANGALSGDVAAWEFRCPNGSWVQHPGLEPATLNAPIATICGGTSPTRARVSFSLDPWGRLYGDIASPPYAKRHNARWLELAVNFVGTGVRNCAVAADPNGCYANAFLRFNLTHTGPAWVTNFDEQWRSVGVPVGSIEGAKALTAEQWLDPTGNGFSKPYVSNVARTEFAGRPVGGSYRLELEVTPDVRLDRIDRVQVLTRSTYWVKQGQFDPSPTTAGPPTLSALNHDLADTAGGDSITITGAELGNAASCTVGGTSATITANTSTSLTFTMPAKPAGVHNVQVVTEGGVSNTLAIEAWDPAVESVQALYQGPNYDGVSSTFTATVGTNVTGIGGPPYPTAVGGFPDFERSTNFTLGSNAFALSSWGGSGDRTLFAVFDAESITTSSPNASVWNNEALIGDAGNYTGLHLRHNGSSFEAIMYDYDSAARVAVVDMTALVSGGGAGRIIVQGKKESGTLYARVIGATGAGSWIAGEASGTTANQTYGLRLGGATQNCPDGILRAAGSKTSAWSDTAATKFEKWARAHFP